MRLLLLLMIGSMLVGADMLPPRPTVLGAPGGRFVFGQISDMRRDQFLLDTQTGRLWVVVADKDGRNSLQTIPFRYPDTPDTTDFAVTGVPPAAPKEIPPELKRP